MADINRKMTLGELRAAKDTAWTVMRVLEDNAPGQFYRSPDLQRALNQAHDIAMRLTYRFDNQKHRERENEDGNYSEAAR